MCDEMLYHYCSFDTFIKIIRNRTIRFSDLNSCCDPDGLTFLWKRHYINLVGPSEQYFTFFSKPEIEGILGKTLYFAFSLTRDSNSPYMWKNYADCYKGISLGFSRKDLEKWADEIMLTHLESKCDQSLVLKNLCHGDVEYSSSKKMLASFNDDISGVENKAPLKKHVTFAGENEYRIIISASKKTSGNVGNDKTVNERSVDMEGGMYVSDRHTSTSVWKEMPTIEWGDKDHGFSPVIDVPFKLEMIKSIRIGPDCKFEKNQMKALMVFMCDDSSFVDEPIVEEKEIVFNGEILKYED